MFSIVYVNNANFQIFTNTTNKKRTFLKKADTEV